VKANSPLPSVKLVRCASEDQPLTGKAVALTNELEDKTTLYLILFSVPKLTLSADVIEFVDRDEAPTSKPKP
jgi:hypothetical protein